MPLSLTLSVNSEGGVQVFVFAVQWSYLPRSVSSHFIGIEDSFVKFIHPHYTKQVPCPSNDLILPGNFITKILVHPDKMPWR